MGIRLIKMLPRPVSNSSGMIGKSSSLLNQRISQSSYLMAYAPCRQPVTIARRIETTVFLECFENDLFICGAQFYEHVSTLALLGTLG